MKLKGVCYDVGRVLEGSLQRPAFNAKVIQREVEIIQKDLHCNAIRIQGLNIRQLVAAAEIALKQGLEVWLSPEMFEKSQQETFDYLVEAASAAESLRQRWPKLVFSLGSELTLFMQGIVEGNNLMERMNAPTFWGNIKAGKHNGPLNEFLAREHCAVKKVFHGNVTYFSVPLETVDWSLFDFIGVDLYRNARIRDAYGGMIKPFLVHNKPVIIGEFGCCTYQGAEKLGGMSWVIMLGMMAENLGSNLNLPKGIAEFLKIPTQVDGHYVRDEALQAIEITEQLGILDASGVNGAFVFTFVSPTLPCNRDPKYDLDMASYSLVKSYPEKETLEEIIRQTGKQGRELLGVEVGPEALTKFIGEVGRHGSTYPDMPWEPKESFKAVGDYYYKHYFLF